MRNSWHAKDITISCIIKFESGICHVNAHTDTQKQRSGTSETIRMIPGEPLNLLLLQFYFYLRNKLVMLFKLMPNVDIL